MAGRFRLYTDTDVDGPVVKALRGAGWELLRGIDAYPERTRDDIHFARAAREGRVLVSNDIDMQALAEAWFLEGRSFPGLVWWPRSHYAVMSPGDFRGGLRGAGPPGRSLRGLSHRPHQTDALTLLGPRPRQNRTSSLEAAP